MTLVRSDFPGGEDGITHVFFKNEDFEIELGLFKGDVCFEVSDVDNNHYLFADPIEFLLALSQIQTAVYDLLLHQTQSETSN